MEVVVAKEREGDRVGISEKRLQRKSSIYIGYPCRTGTLDRSKSHCSDEIRS